VIGPYRRAVQTGAFAFMFIVPALNVYEIFSVTGTFYAIKIGGLEIADPSVILQSVFAVGRFSAPLLSASIFPVLFALLFGRAWCGWICPYHLVSDAACWLRRSVRGRALKERELHDVSAQTRPFTANVSRFAFLTLGISLAGILGLPVLNYVSAPGILSTEAMILVKEHTLSVEATFILTILFIEMVYAPRFWCRMFCPTGALLSLFRNRFTVGVRNRPKGASTPCCREDSCSAACPMGLAPFREAADLLCTNCGRCIDSCAHNRLSFTGFGGFA
jgi:ferredoxin-type protein NapH